MTPRSRSLFALIALAAAPAAAQSAHDGAGSWIVKGRLVVPVEAGAVSNGAVRITGGKIDFVGAAAEAPAVPAEHVVEFPDGFVYPGFVDAGSFQGIRRERNDVSRPYHPAHRIADAVDPRHPDFAANFAAGVTTVHLTPGFTAPVGGRTAVLKVGPDGRVRFLAPDAGLGMSLVESIYPAGRAPTSLQGALLALNEASSHLAPALDPFRKGAHPVFVAAFANREVLVACGLRGDLGFRTVLLADLGCGRFADEIKAGVAGVVLSTLTNDRKPFEWGYFNDLMESGVPVAFGSWAPLRAPSSVRLSAVIAARRGVPPERALRAITLDAARILGVDAHVGSLKAGKDADLVVLSAPVEDARARLLLCVQDGKVVFRAGKDS